MKKLITAHKEKEDGSAMLITIIILLVLMVIVATAGSISGMQFNLAILNRNTSNTYYLAKSAMEKQVDTMNKAVETQLTKIVKEMNSSSNGYITKLISEDSSITHNTTKIQVDNTTLRKEICKELYTYLKDSYKTNTITYTVQSDRLTSDYVTQIEIEITDEKAVAGTYYNEDDPKFRVITTATTKKGSEIYDKQTVEGLIEIILPATINNEIHEKYEFAKEPSDGSKVVVPEILKSALICYSDVVVSDSGELNVAGDMYVGGTPNIAQFGTNEYPEADQNGGVIVLNGGKLNVTGNLYTTRNVLATAGWGGDYDGGGNITVTGNLIAYTLGIVDDFYVGSDNQSPFSSDNQVQGAQITVQGNVMVDNDVMIDRWVNGGEINVSHTLFGVNGGTDATPTGIDPNQSSGVFSQGPGSLITAERMLVAGQPYITIAEGQKPLKLWESIGEPFDGLASYEGYKTNHDVNDNANNPKYLESTSPFYDFIASNKIKTNFAKTYAVAKVSGIDTSSTPNAEKKGQSCTGTLGNNQMDAADFLFQGSSSILVTNATTSTDATNIQTVITGLATYYAGTAIGTVKEISGLVPTNNFRGVRGYMTVMRSILYQKFESSLPVTETFATALKTSVMPTSTNEWSYATPIVVVKPTAATGEEVDISKFYVDEGDGNYKPYPSIIINISDKPLVVKFGESGKSEFTGIIISQGPIEFKAGLTIIGTVIAGGPTTMPTPGVDDRKGIFEGSYAGIIVNDGDVTIQNDPDIILDISVKNHALYRSVLDMLYMTNYSESALGNIMAAQAPNTKKVLKYTNKSILEVSTEGIEVAIKSLKKIQ